MGSSGLTSIATPLKRRMHKRCTEGQRLCMHRDTICTLRILSRPPLIKRGSWTRACMHHERSARATESESVACSMPWNSKFRIRMMHWCEDPQHGEWYVWCRGRPWQESSVQAPRLSTLRINEVHTVECRRKAHLARITPLCAARIIGLAPRQKQNLH